MKDLKIALLKPLETVINKAGSVVETIRLLGELLREVKTARAEMDAGLKKVQDGVDDIKLYLARQEEIAKQMLEQGHLIEVDEHGDFDDLEEFDDDDKKDLN